MDQPVELVSLVCVKCGTRLPAQPDEVAWVCGQCGQGLQLDEKKGLAPLDVQYAAGISAGEKGRPFWVAEGQVTFQQRQTYSGNQNADAQRFWGQPRRFFIPALTCTLATLLSLGCKLITQPPDLRPGPAVPFHPVTLSVDDVEPMAEFIVMAVEADRKDNLKDVRFTLKLGPPVLWILP